MMFQRKRGADQPRRFDRPLDAPRLNDQWMNCWHCYRSGGDWEWNTELTTGFWIWRPCSFCGGRGEVYFREDSSVEDDQ